LTRSQTEQLAFVLRLMRAGELKYGTAAEMLLNMIEAAERGHVVGQDASLEQSSKGADHDKRSV
jgi:hypothetical protein